MIWSDVITTPLKSRYTSRGCGPSPDTSWMSVVVGMCQSKRVIPRPTMKVHSAGRARSTPTDATICAASGAREPPEDGLVEHEPEQWADDEDHQPGGGPLRPVQAGVELEEDEHGRERDSRVAEVEDPGGGVGEYEPGGDERGWRRSPSRSRCHGRTDPSNDPIPSADQGQRGPETAMVGGVTPPTIACIPQAEKISGRRSSWTCR